MKTAKQLIAEVDAELNAVKAADMGLEAAEAFALEASNQFMNGDVVKTRDALSNLSNLLGALRKAVPANVTPASAGPVGQSPQEQYLVTAKATAEDFLGKMQEAVGKVPELLDIFRHVTEHALNAKLTAEQGIAAAKEG